MTREQSGSWYVPPVGPLYDFDDAEVDASVRAGAKRWLAGFNGRVGHPAQNVQLAWRCPTGARVAVGCPVDPWRPQTVAALESEWDAFFQDHPALKPA